MKGSMLFFRAAAMLLAGSLLVASCASPKANSRPQDASNEQSERAGDGDPEQAAPAEQTQDTQSGDAQSTQSSGQNNGPIDLGFEDDGSSTGGPIIINRPDDRAEATELGDLSRDPSEDLSTQYDQACESVADCEDLELPDCPGEMQCVEAQCAFFCAEDLQSNDERDDEPADGASDDADVLDDDDLEDVL